MKFDLLTGVTFDDGFFQFQDKKVSELLPFIMETRYFSRAPFLKLSIDIWSYIVCHITLETGACTNVLTKDTREEIKKSKLRGSLSPPWIPDLKPLLILAA